jgi:hypothetical protein
VTPDKTREVLVAEFDRLRPEVVDLSGRAVTDANDRALAAEALNVSRPETGTAGAAPSRFGRMMGFHRSA